MLTRFWRWLLQPWLKSDAVSPSSLAHALIREGRRGFEG